MRRSPSKWLLGLFLLLGMGVRLPYLLSEPLWFDETVSVQLSEGTLAGMLRASARDSTPPLYFLGLALWRAVAGDSDRALHGYSLVWSVVGMLVLFGWAKRAAGQKVAFLALGLLLANPIDIYFATEVRMYSQGAALGTLSAWMLWEWKRHRDGRRHFFGAAYAATAFALVMTHYVGVVLLLVEAGWIGISLLRAKSWGALLEYAAWGGAAALLFGSWYFYLAFATGGLNSANFAWMTHPPLSYYVNYLWNEFFWGRNGAGQSRWWGVSLAGVLLAGTVVGRVFLRHNSSVLFPALMLLLASPPLAGILGVLYQPLYNRERFSVFLAPFFALVLAESCSHLRRWGSALWIGVLALMSVGAAWQLREVSRTDWPAVARLHAERRPAALFLFPYYQDLPARRYISASHRTPPPRDLERLVSQLQGRRIWIGVEEGYQFRHYAGERKYHQRLMGLGTATSVAGTPVGLTLTEILVGESVPPEYQDKFRLWSPPQDRLGFVEGFDRPEAFFALQEDPEGKRVRWSPGKASLRVSCGDEPATITLELEWPPLSSGFSARFFAGRQPREADLFAGPPAVTLESSRVPQKFSVDLPIPAGTVPVVVGWQSDTVNLRRAGVSADDRDLGLLVRWIAVRK